MNIFYMNNTLYIEINNEINDNYISSLRKRVFSILNDYNINNIVLNIITDDKNNILINDFINEYKSKYNGHIRLN